MPKADSSSPTPAPAAIRDLVQKFAEHRDTYHRAGYNETLLRRDFLDPFFEALGWDMTNRQGYAEAYRDVIHEDALQVEKSARAPDYCFRVGGTRKFFVEAKKPAVDIKSDVGPAFQLRRYAWTAKLPLSILTDFEEFAVYDCRKKPDKNDKASEARILLLNYSDYLTRWDEIADVFSREAILKGSFDKFAESTKKKRGTAPVDEEFLKEIEAWREDLAKNLSLRNESLTDRQLNVAVRRIIDRIIFLRMCEGRGIEPYERLRSLLNGESVYRRLVELFHRADEKYNSGLFHFQNERGREPPDELTPELKLDDKVLKDIIRRLYFPESPYEFAALPADILGQVYEQFLGKVIRLTAGHRAKIEEKPEVRKAGGVYYTPTYIVDYIVENTVGKLLEGKTPQEVGGLTATFKPAKNARPLTVLDPACGSGSFLIVAYQYLLDWYLKQYTEADDPKKHARGANPRIYQSPTGDWRLTIAERKRILLAHIYGVDIDYQAVEVTKLSLLLKVLEKETEATVRQLEAFHKQRALPDLADNIKCGNSLIGPDFYQGQQRNLFSDEDRLRINAFDWRGKHGFPNVFNSENPGFDVVIGNPPWLMAGYYVKDTLDSLKRQYVSARGKFDLYYLFIEQGCTLLSQTGRFGMIVPNKLFHTSAARELRRLLCEHRWISRVVDFGDFQVFKGATNYSCMLFLAKTSSKTIEYIAARANLEQTANFKCTSSNFGLDPWHFEDDAFRRLFEKLELSSNPLELLTSRFGTGVQTGADKIFVVKADENEKIESKLCRPLFKGRDIRRYSRNSHPDSLVFPYREAKDEFVIFEESELKHFAKAYQRLSRSRDKLSNRIWFGKSAVELSGRWFGLMYLDSPASFRSPHLLTPSLSNRANFMIGNGDLFATGTAGVTSIIPATGIKENIHYLLGVLNSRLLSLYAVRHSPIFSGGYYKFSAPYLRRLPIRRIDRSAMSDCSRHDRVVECVAQMINLVARVREVKTDHERTALQHQIEHTDREIDALVYELYGLSDQEIALVENATRND